MPPRRRRVLLYTERVATQNEIKQTLGRSVEMIAASDLATVEAALRLYQTVDAVIAEKSCERNTPITVLRLAEKMHPGAKRVALVEHAAIQGVFDAVHDRTITDLMFLPFNAEQLQASIGLEKDAATLAAEARAMPTMMRRAFAQPPLTGGIKASSSPSLSS